MAGFLFKIESVDLCEAGERPHLCPICHATFTRKDHVTAHINKKHRQG